MAVIRCGAILFDLDGVLMDSRVAVERAWERWAAGHGIDPVAVLAEAHGRRTIDTIRAIAPLLDVETEARLLEEAESVDFDGVTTLPGAAELLAGTSFRKLDGRDLGHPGARDGPSRARRDFRSPTG